MRICFVALELLGPFQGGGIATALAGQAEHHARDHDVTVLYVNSNLTAKDVPEWEAFYARRGIRFVLADLTNYYDLDVKIQNRSFAVKEYLDTWDESFDVLFFHDYRGLGYYTALARQMGLGFAGTRIGTVIHGPSAWARSLNVSRDDEAALTLYDIERKQVAYSDFVIAPSNDILDWCRAQGWTLPADTRVISNLLPFRVDSHSGLERGERATVDEVCFYGRLETRKGFFTFLEAINYLHKNRLALPRKVTFLGSFCLNGYRNAASAVLEAAAGWECEFELLNSLGHEEAIATLVKRRPLTVIPSRDESFGLTAYECLAFGIPCLMADRGALRTLAAEPERSDLLVEPVASTLALRIRDCLETGAVIGAIDPVHLDAEEVWDRLLADLGTPAPPPDPTRAVISLDPNSKPAPAPEVPLVSVVLVHHERLEMLDIALESLRRQTWAPLEILVVDDGSAPHTLAKLTALIEAKGDDRITLLSQDIRYVGAARNLGAAQAKGDYLLFMDDDNVALPYEVETFVCTALATGADVLNTVSRIFRYVGAERSPYEIYLPTGPSLPLAFVGNTFGDANALIRRDVFEALGGFDEDYGVGCEDYALFNRAFLAGKRMQLVPEVLFDYRAEADSMTRTLKPSNYLINQMHGAAPLFQSDAQVSMTDLRPLLRFAFYKATAEEFKFWRSESSKTRRHPELEDTLARFQKAPNGPGAVEAVAGMLAADGHLTAALQLLERNKVEAKGDVLAKLQELDSRRLARAAAAGVQRNLSVNPAFEFWTLGTRCEGVSANQYVANEWLVPGSKHRPGVIVSQRHDVALMKTSQLGIDTYLRAQINEADPEGYMFLAQRNFEIGALLQREMALSLLVRASWEGDLPIFLRIIEKLGTDRIQDLKPIGGPPRVTRDWRRVRMEFDLRAFDPASLPGSAFFSVMIPLPIRFVNFVDITDVVLVPAGDAVDVAPYISPAEFQRAAHRCFTVGHGAKATPLEQARLRLSLTPAQAERVSKSSRLQIIGPCVILGDDGIARRVEVRSAVCEGANAGGAILILTLDAPTVAGVVLRDLIAVTNYVEG